MSSFIFFTLEEISVELRRLLEGSQEKLIANLVGAVASLAAIPVAILEVER